MSGTKTESWSGPCAATPVEASRGRKVQPRRQGAHGATATTRPVGPSDLPAEVLLARIPEAHRHPLRPPPSKGPAARRAALLAVLVAAEDDPAPCGCELLRCLKIGDAARALGATDAELREARHARLTARSAAAEEPIG